MRFGHDGHAVPGGYNGTIAAYHQESGECMGHLDYHLDQSGERETGVIANIQVHPDHRRKGVATSLFLYMHQYMPDTRFSHGWATDDGEAWRRSLPQYVRGDMPPYSREGSANAPHDSQHADATAEGAIRAAFPGTADSMRRVSDPASDSRAPAPRSAVSPPRRSLHLIRGDPERTA